MDRPTAKLEHASPGRVRARVLRGHRSPATMERVRVRLKAAPGVSHVEVNPATGSVLLRGPNRARLEEALNDALVVFRSLGGEEPADQGVGQVVDLVRAGEERLRQATGGRFSLRWLVPATFVGLGVRELLRQGLTIGTIPWYVLLYYGLDSFLKLYPEHGPLSGAGPDGSRPDGSGPDGA